MTIMDAFDDWLRRTSNLRLSTQGGRSKPYKPAMLLAAILLIRKGQFADNLLTLGELTPVFDQVLAIVAPESAGPSERSLPFRHLASDGIWTLVARQGEQVQLDAMVEVGRRARDLLRLTEGVHLPGEVFDHLRKHDDAAAHAVACVLHCYARVFADWGLANARAAEETLVGWLGGAVQDPPLEERTISERHVEEWVQQNWARTPFARMGLQLDRRQHMTPVNVIDLLAIDRARQEWWVIEIKRGNSSDAVVGQLARYRGWIASEMRIPVARARGVVLTDAVSEKLRLAMQTQSGAELWRYDPSIMSMDRID